MPSSARLDNETAELLEKAAEVMRTTKSQVVRESLREYCAAVIEKKIKTPWEIYRSVHKASQGSGHGKRVSTGKKILKIKFEENRRKWSL